MPDFPRPPGRLRLPVRQEVREARTLHRAVRGRRSGEGAHCRRLAGRGCPAASAHRPVEGLGGSGAGAVRWSVGGPERRQESEGRVVTAARTLPSGNSAFPRAETRGVGQRIVRSLRRLGAPRRGGEHGEFLLREDTWPWRPRLRGRLPTAGHAASGRLRKAGPGFVRHLPVDGGGDRRGTEPASRAPLWCHREAIGPGAAAPAQPKSRSSFRWERSSASLLGQDTHAPLG
jgi:hypothetical protein